MRRCNGSATSTLAVQVTEVQLELKNVHFTLKFPRTGRPERKRRRDHDKRLVYSKRTSFVTKVKYTHTNVTMTLLWQPLMSKQSRFNLSTSQESRVVGRHDSAAGAPEQPREMTQPREMIHPRTNVVLQSRQFSASSSTACSAY